MKFSKSYLTLFAAILALNLSNAAADFNADAETILNWGEKTFPKFLPNHDTTKTFDQWLYRFYSATNLYVGINSQDNGVYVLSGVPGAQPARFKSVVDLLNEINNSNTSVCDQTQIPEGFSYSQSGNVLKVTTNGQCVAVPKKPVCTPPATAAGISVLSTSDIKTFSLSGITFANPKVGELIEPEIQKATKIQSCIINATQAYAAKQIDLDICLDVTDNVKDFSSLATVTPPVTMKMQGSVLNSQVDDCFKSDATIIVNALTKESWTKVDGDFVQNKN